MNNERRRQIKKNNNIIKEVIEKLEEYKSEVELIQLDEEYAFDNMPIGFQEGQKGQDIQDALDKMDESISKIDQVISSLILVKEELISL